MATRHYDWVDKKWNPTITYHMVSTTYNIVLSLKQLYSLEYNYVKVTYILYFTVL